MSVLTDDEIRKRMVSSGLVSGGELGRAAECSYAFRPGAAFLPGQDDPPIVFPGAALDAAVIVKPAQMIWIRTLERVSIPHDLVGFWWQTNSLSRKGLMLVNMSMVEPGYSGDLACLFVNFAKSNILIDAGTTIAKMVFCELTGALSMPVSPGTSRARYDSGIRELSIDQPKSFLQVGDLAVSLHRQQEAAESDIRTATDNAQMSLVKATVEAQASAVDAIAASRKEQTKKFEEDVTATLKTAFYWAAGAIAFLTVATLASDYVKDHFLDVTSIARREAEKTLGDRLTIAASPDAQETARRLAQQVDELTRRLAVLESKAPGK